MVKVLSRWGGFNCYSIHSCIVIVHQSLRCKQFLYVCYLIAVLLDHIGKRVQWWLNDYMMDMYSFLVRCVGVINEMSGNVGDRFEAF